MNRSYQKTLLASVIAAVLSAPAWSGEATSPASGNEPSSPWVPVEDQSQGTGSAWNKQEYPATHSTTDISADNPLYAMTPEELSSLEVLGRDGKEVGKIKQVVSSRVNGKLYAVIASGGILGIGAKQTAVSLDMLQLAGQQVHMSATGDELAAGEKYAPDMYIEVKPDDQPVSEFSAFEEKAK